ncbi:uncharacterized protein LOC128092332 [Culex pipiens pallens]|uniref:uncharacterized protein LOC128092332 n=1 Tax=Culex pipiens pallens TaxID=42434 RepID=UPI0022AAEB67|nr:uncharacterized protein LOC128092332 [Culex pipiens pallens]
MLWEALFFMRAWRNWTLKNRTSSFQCVTANTYACLEINAHSLVLAARDCRDRGRPEEFLVRCFGSQDVKATFRNLRSMTTMSHTQTNLTFKEIGEKLRRAHMLHQIQHRNRIKFRFPGHTSPTNVSVLLTLPTDAEIKAALTSAEGRASEVLGKLGLLLGLWEDLIVSDSESDTEDHEDHEPGQEVYEAKHLFSNFSGQIALPNSTSDKHIYLIRDDHGKVFHVKKSSVVWMLTVSKVQEKARMIRYKQPKPN